MPRQTRTLRDSPTRHVQPGRPLRLLTAPLPAPLLGAERLVGVTVGPFGQGDRCAHRYRVTRDTDRRRSSPGGIRGVACRSELCSRAGVRGSSDGRSDRGRRGAVRAVTTGSTAPRLPGAAEHAGVVVVGDHAEPRGLRVVVGATPSGTRPCWPGRSRSPSGWLIRRTAAASAGGFRRRRVGR
jgi:hypothetical protein